LLLYQEHAEFSPFGAVELTDLIEAARHEISISAPLRNPIMRSEAFLKIQPRLKTL
jgi:hypothetical protein